MPEEKITKKSYDNNAVAWAKARSTSTFFSKELKKFQELLPSGRILEIGAGSGRDAEELINMGYDYVGTDISESFIRMLKKKLPSAEFHHQSVYDLFLSGKFDGFWASAVLLHVPKKRTSEALQKIKSFMRPEGVGFISLKDGEGEEVLENEISGKKFKRFFSFWNKEEFENVLKQNGFELVYYEFRPESKDTRWHLFFVRVRK